MARRFWWPTSKAEQYQLVKNIRDKVPLYAAQWGLAAGDVTDITDLCTAILESQDFRVSTTTTDLATTEWRDQVWYGEPTGDAAAQAPVYTVKGATTYKRGSVTLLFQWRDNIVTRSGFDTASGEDVGFLGPETGGEDPSSVKPKLTVKPAEVGGFGYGVIITGRGKSDQWKLSGALFGTSNWQDLGMLTGKTYEGAWPGGGPNPVQVQFRAQLYKDNAPYGLPSDIVVVTLIP